MIRILALFLFVSINSLFGTLVFIHIPHSGGMSIARTIRTMFRPEDVYPLNRGYDKNAKCFFTIPPILPHIKYLHGHYGLYHLKELLINKKKHLFVFNLRAPLDREITRYRRHILKNRDYNYNVNFLMRALADNPNLSDEEVLASAKANLKKIDYIIDFKDIENSFDKTIRLCLPNRSSYPKLPHFNRTKKIPVPDEVIEKIKVAQEYDTELYQYILRHYFHKIVR